MMTCRHRRTTPHAAPIARGARGFSLVEVLVTLVVVGVLGSISSTLIWSGIDVHRRAGIASMLSEEASAAMERVVHELRAIPAAGDPPRLDIIDVTPSSIRWTAGSAIEQQGEELLLRRDGTAPRVLARDVSVFEVRCYGRDGGSLPEFLSGQAVRNIWRIEIIITLERDEVSETLRMRIFPRSLMGAAP